MKIIEKFLSKFVKQTTTATAETLEEYGYRKITSRDEKGLTTITRDKQLKIVFNLFLVNPFAKTIITTINDFVFGDGFKYDFDAPKNFPQYKIEQARKIIDDFWKVNKFDLRLEKKGIDLSLNGMLILPVFVNKHGGQVRLGFIDPLNLDKVVTNPLNIEDIQQIKLKSESGLKFLNTIKENETDINSEAFGMLEGECFFFSINNVSNQPEGVSDLLESADTIDMLGQLLFNILKHSEMSYRVNEHITLEGFNESQIDIWKKNNPRPKAGARYVTNEKVKINLLTPGIKASNSEGIVRMFKNIVLLSKRLPEMWFADGGNTNLATAVEQSTAIFKLIYNKQQYWISILTEILTFVLHQAYINKKEGFSLTKDELLNKIKINITAPKFESKDLKEYSETINNIKTFLTDCVSSGYLTKDTAGNISRKLTSMLGFKVDEKTELENLKKEIKTKTKEETEISI